MRWWTLPAFLLCLVVGYLLGARSVKPDAAHAPRAADARTTPDQPSAPVPVAPPANRPVASGDAAPPPIAVVAADPTSATEDPESGYGALVVDFTGFDGPEYVRLEATGIDGSMEYMEQGADDNHAATFDLWPSEVVVRWEDRGARHRFVARVRIEQGRITRLLAADPRYAPIPEPPEMAILDVRLFAPGGEPVPDIDISLAGNVLDAAQEIDVRTDAEGCARFRIRGGTYRVRARGRGEEISLRAGERRSLDLRHEKHGMVVVDPALEGIYTLQPRDGGSGDMESVPREGGAARFVLVPPGPYDLWYRFASTGRNVPPDTATPSRRLVASLQVRSARTECVRHSPEAGLLEVDVVPPAAPLHGRWQMRVSAVWDEANPATFELAPEDGRLRGRTGPMSKGLYKVEILADGQVREERYALVGYGPTELTTRVER